MNPTLFGFKLFPLILFLPNMHFWSAGIGKDTMIFFALALFIYCLLDVKRNIIGLITSFYLAFYIRPHIALVMIVGAGIALFISSRGISTFWRVSSIIAAVVVFYLISGTVFQFVGVQEDSIENYEDVASIRAKNLSRSNVGSAIAMSSYPVPFRIFTFFYRPLFVDSVNILGLVVSFENLIYLALTLSVFKGSVLRQFWRMPIVFKACIFISLATAYFMSGSLSNLGIIIRQKNMVMFMVVLVCMFMMSEARYATRSRIVPAKMRQRRPTTLNPNLDHGASPGAKVS
ncbi:MAG: hypothetical protein QM762_25000 [Chryseolinea sp.]